EKMSRATSLSAVGQQLSVSTGVAIGAAVVELTVRSKASATITAADFPLAFLIVAAISASSVLMFARLPRDAGAELAGRPGKLPEQQVSGPPAPRVNGDRDN